MIGPVPTPNAIGVYDAELRDLTAGRGMASVTQHNPSPKVMTLWKK